MKDKFRENFKIVLPAAIITFVLFIILTMNIDFHMEEELSDNIWQVIPYLIVLIGALAESMSLLYCLLEPFFR